MFCIITWAMLLCSVIAQASFPEIDTDGSEQCFRAKELSDRKDYWLSSDEYFVTAHPLSERQRYPNFYQSGDSVSMVFGTEYTNDEKFHDVFMPSCDQVKRLLEILEADVVAYLKQQQGMKTLDVKNVVGLYLMPNVSFGMASFTPYRKVPCTQQYLPKFLNSPEESSINLYNEEDMFIVCAAPQCCVVINDVFDSGDTEFQLVAKIVDEVLPNMTQEQIAEFKIVLATIYLKNGCDKETEVVFDGKTYPIGVVSFRGNVRERLMAHAKLHVMDDYIASQTKTLTTTTWLMQLISGRAPLSQKEALLALEEKERRLALRSIFDKDSGLKKMAQERYLKYVADCIYKLSVNDFVNIRWIDQKRVDAMRIVMPTEALSATASLDLANPLQHLYNQEGIKHFLEPIFYFPKEETVLDQPAVHAKVVAEHTGDPNRHEAHLLELLPGSDDHYCVQEDWLNLCQSRVEWKEGETIGVILYGLDRMGRTPKESHPHLLQDIVCGIQKGLQDHGYNARFFCLSWDGHFTDYSSGSRTQPPNDYPKPSWKKPVRSRLLHESVRVVRDARKFFYNAGVYGGVRTDVSLWPPLV